MLGLSFSLWLAEGPQQGTNMDSPGWRLQTPGVDNCQQDRALKGSNADSQTSLAQRSTLPGLDLERFWLSWASFHMPSLRQRLFTFVPSGDSVPRKRYRIRSASTEEGNAGPRGVLH